jgi:hypothetical protein
MTRVLVHIDRLVLTGFGPQDGQALASGLQQELARAFAAPGAARSVAAMASVPRLQLRSVSVERGATAQRVGQRVAQGIGQEVSR